MNKKMFVIVFVSLLLVSCGRQSSVVSSGWDSGGSGKPPAVLRGLHVCDHTYEVLGGGSPPNVFSPGSNGVLTSPPGFGYMWNMLDESTGEGYAFGHYEGEKDVTYIWVAFLKQPGDSELLKDREWVRANAEQLDESKSTEHDVKLSRIINNVRYDLHCWVEKEKR